MSPEEIDLDAIVDKRTEIFIQTDRESSEELMALKSHGLPMRSFNCVRTIVLSLIGKTEKVEILISILSE